MADSYFLKLVKRTENTYEFDKKEVKMADIEKSWKPQDGLQVVEIPSQGISSIILTQTTLLPEKFLA